ncbi:MAG: type II toxin-antitoxin system RelE/ParE family toxin [Caulobacterales bacterium]
MKRRTVLLAPEAEADLAVIYDYVAQAASPQVAGAYLERVEAFVRGFETAAERGTTRDDVRPGLRIVGFERRITVAFVVEDQRVTILRLFYGGQDWASALDQDV